MSDKKNFLIEKILQQGRLLTVKNAEYRKWAVSFLKNLQILDTQKGDLTGEALFSKNNSSLKAYIDANESGMIAGLEEFAFFLRANHMKIQIFCNDGDLIKKGQQVAELSGPAVKLLEFERIGLDLLGRMSGIATLTHRLAAKARGKAAVAATRKTLWGWLDKKAVYVGGGLTHRLGLWQAMMVKDNHLAALQNQGIRNPYQEALKRANAMIKLKKPVFVEMEVESMKQAAVAANAFLEMSPVGIPMVILLDNFSSKDVKKTVSLFQKNGWRKKILLEASGGIHEKNIGAYAATGVDVISLGALTHSAPMFNFSQRITHAKNR